jgi:hypothetical protein
MLTAWADLLYVSQNCLPDSLRKGVRLLAHVLLGATDCDQLSLPIKVIQTEPPDLAYAESVNGEEQYDSVVSNISTPFTCGS